MVYMKETLKRIFISWKVMQNVEIILDNKIEEKSKEFDWKHFSGGEVNNLRE